MMILISCTPVVNRKQKTSSTNTTYRNYKSVDKKSTSKSQNDRSNRAMHRITPKRKNENHNAYYGKLDHLIEKYWGTPYRFGRADQRGFDCSGFVQKVFSEAYNIKLPRTSYKQFKRGKSISRQQMKYGDLVFFNTNGRGVSHVGVYIGNNKFAHASTSQGVTISSLSNSYYAQRYLGARRVLN